MKNRWIVLPWHDIIFLWYERKWKIIGKGFGYKRNFIRKRGIRMEKGVGKHMGSIALLLAVLMLITLGCANGAGKVQELQGHWVDVNSKATLDISGNQFTFTHGEWQANCNFKLKTEDDMTYIINADGGNTEYFDFMTYIRVNEDGSLEASDMVLDGESHHYRFVRADKLDQEMAIQDLSKDAPKTIQSKEINTFSLSFKNEGGSYGLAPKWPNGSYSWEISLRDGQYNMRFRVMGPSYVVMNFDENVSPEYVAGLANLLAEQGISQYNGYHMKNNVHRHGYSLYVTYASKEKMRILAEGDAAAKCVFDIVPLLNYAAKQPLPDPY